nr:MAG TPA: BppU domain protein [Caudoviricetes sp.]
MAISLAHKSITIDVNDRNAPNVVGIVNVNDKATRYLDVTLTASGEKLTFADCTVTATFATDGYLISDSVACTLNSTADVITVPLEDFKSMSGFLAIEIKIANGETQVLNTPLTLKVMVTPSLAENSKINSNSAGSFVEISREVVTARGGQNSLGARLDKTDKSIARKLDSMPFDSEPKNNSPCYLTSGTVYNALLVKADKTALATKYDSANIESGTSTLTPYSTVTDKIKSANCTYKTIGDIVIVSATVKMNAVSLGGNSMCLLIDLPYKCISEDNVFCVGISNLGKLFKFAIPKNNTWLQFSTQDKAAYTFADGEQINVICLYKIK